MTDYEIQLKKIGRIFKFALLAVLLALLVGVKWLYYFVKGEGGKTDTTTDTNPIIPDANADVIGGSSGGDSGDAGDGGDGGSCG